MFDMSVSLFYGIIQPCKKKYMNVIESVVYCAADLILLNLESSIPNDPQSHNIGVYDMALYVSLIFLVLPSLVLLVIFVAKIFTCLCCIRESKFIQRAMKIFCTTGDPDTLLPQELPDRLEHPLDYEPLN